jgi:hypothetical protein
MKTATRTHSMKTKACGDIRCVVMGAVSRLLKAFRLMYIQGIRIHSEGLTFVSIALTHVMRMRMFACSARNNIAFLSVTVIHKTQDENAQGGQHDGRLFEPHHSSPPPSEAISSDRRSEKVCLTVIEYLGRGKGWWEGWTCLYIILQSVIYRVYKRSIFPVKCKPTIIYTSEPNGAEPQHKVAPRASQTALYIN